VERAFERGCNYLYWGSIRKGGFADALRNLAPQRERMILVLQSYSRSALLMRWSFERALKAIGFDSADVLLLGLWNHRPPERILEEARRLKERGLVRMLAISAHHRPMVAEFARGSEFDVVHFRYNAVHTGAERDILPHLGERSSRPGTVCYTATNWGQLVNPKKVTKGERVPAGADAYRFVLSRPEVDVCMTGPKDAAQMAEALEALERGPMSEEELAWMRRVGAGIYGKG
jgi:aryl-alcohol dehydrogenase-like predicted oxidoreductase